jgi:hypothetical protein
LVKGHEVIVCDERSGMRARVDENAVPERRRVGLIVDIERHRPMFACSWKESV